MSVGRVMERHWGVKRVAPFNDFFFLRKTVPFQGHGLLSSTDWKPNTHNFRQIDMVYETASVDLFRLGLMIAETTYARNPKEILNSESLLLIAQQSK
jgi:hypothetical protein